MDGCLAAENVVYYYGVSLSLIHILTSETTVICVLMDGPAVSLNGSPTVSPLTAALCASLPLPPKWPDSMYFLSLIHIYYDARIADGLPGKNINTMAPVLALSYLYEYTGDETYGAVCKECGYEGYREVQQNSMDVATYCHDEIGKMNCFRNYADKLVNPPIFPEGKRILQFYKIWAERGRKTEKVEPMPTSECSLI